MLTARPSSFWSTNYTIEYRRREVTKIDIGWWREAGSFQLDGRTFKLGRDGRYSGAFFLESEGVRIVSAKKPSAFQRRFVVEHDGAVYDLGTDLGRASVHPALFVGEDPHLAELLAGPLDGPLVVAPHDAHQRDHSRPDLARDLARDRHSRTGHALQDDAQIRRPQPLVAGL